VTTQARAKLGWRIEPRGPVLGAELGGVEIRDNVDPEVAPGRNARKHGGYSSKAKAVARYVREIARLARTELN
jgi:hypothetical protein